MGFDDSPALGLVDVRPVCMERRQSDTQRKRKKGGSKISVHKKKNAAKIKVIAAELGCQPQHIEPMILSSCIFVEDEDAEHQVEALLRKVS